ncbi:putative membrane protein [Rhodovulum iodosum]|uniref:Membrane protein n=1 Tax=Rhodovulum iodosum TaxID=68291 RepID=A0ABV3XWX2_9RHOB|nr:heparan-alpha-glucosaminide N-acetyltransferase [Rhodovulum robiginosum]RSK34091.1 DUF1624 domain-containing protein [Rhodovulum robiginosum]
MLPAHDNADAPGTRPLGTESRPRLQWIDLARSTALLGMVVFHFAHDLEFFGFVDAGTTLTGGWAVFARIVAGSFLFISGVSFVVAYQNRFRARAWVKRLIRIAGAACIISLVTYAALPSRFIYFGILHAIAGASVIGLVFLRMPAWLVAAAALAVVIADATLGRALFTSPWLAWTGLSAAVRPSVDFVPLVPWLSAFLAGMALAKAVPPAGIEPGWPSALPVHLLAWPGRHSLAVYLLHQPVLFGVIGLVAWASG